MYKSFENRIELLQAHVKKRSQEVTLYEISAQLGHDSYYLLSFFFTIPFMQPIPLVGISTAIGVLLAFFSLLIIAGKKLYIPNCCKCWKVTSKNLLKWTNYFLLFCKKGEKWLYPRGAFFQKNFFVRKINGLFILLLSLLLALPIPFPFTNTLPALSIAVISIGALREDSVAVSLGWALGGCTFVYIGSSVLIPMSYLLNL